MQRCFGVLVVIASLLASVPAGAQSGQGSLNGYVKDQQGGVLPGVTVTATGPALLAPVVAVTDNAGFDRLQNLPPGTVTVSAELRDSRPSGAKGFSCAPAAPSPSTST